mmetsp:Transcript_51725/g.60432  ORF Transcript_51725/g.60432 Transcript_51725/m.60432 type:complete len:872 (-) Transcript_51725:2473-5088(-)
MKTNKLNRKKCFSIVAVLIVLSGGAGLMLSLLMDDSKIKPTPSPETIGFVPVKSQKPVIINTNKVSTSSYGPPPSPCMECITRDSLDQKRRSLLILSETSSEKERHLPQSENDSCKTPSLLQKLIETGEPYFQMVDNLEAAVTDANYITVCDENEAPPSQTMVPSTYPTIFSETSPDSTESSQCTCPYRDKEEYPSISCEEVVSYDIFITLRGKELFGIMTENTIAIYENITSSFLQDNYDLACSDNIERIYENVTLEEQKLEVISPPSSSPKEDEVNEILSKCRLCQNEKILDSRKVIESTGASCGDLDLTASLLPVENIDACEDIMDNFSNKCCKEVAMPSMSPATMTRMSALYSILSPISGEDDLSNKESAQYRSMEWLANDDDRQVPINDTKTIIQRYSMAVLYHSTGGVNWYEYKPKELPSEQAIKEIMVEATTVMMLEAETGVMMQETTGKTESISFETRDISSEMTESNLQDMRQFSVLSANHECKWLIDVDCDDEYQIKNLDLSDTNLVGTLPREIGQLTNLVTLSLDDNMIVGSIPEEFGGLTNIQYLNLYKNEFTGDLPQSFQNLTQLTYINLSLNQFDDISPLCLNYGYEGVLVGSTGEGPLFTYDCFDTECDCCTCEVPPSSSPVTNRFQTMFVMLSSVSGNELLDEGSPQYQSLEWIANGDDRQVPLNDTNAIIQRYTMAVLYHSTDGDNWGSLGWYEQEMGTLTFLSADHECEWFNGISCNEEYQIGGIYLGMASLAGSLPREIGQLSHLTSLDLSNNNITEDLPAEFGLLADLESLYLSDNKFTGDVPQSFENITKLNYVDLSSNQFNNISALCSNYGYGGDLIGGFSEEVSGGGIVFNYDCFEVECDCCTCDQLS